MKYEIDNRLQARFTRRGYQPPNEEVQLLELPDGVFGIDKDGDLWINTDNSFVCFEENEAFLYDLNTKVMVTPVRATIKIE